MRRRAKRRRRRWELTWLHFVNLHIVTNCFVVIKRAKRRRRRLEESWHLAWQHIIEKNPTFGTKKNSFKLTRAYVP